MPTIVQAVPIEDELHDMLAAAGDVRVVDGRDRGAFIEAVKDADGVLLSPIVRVDQQILDLAPKLKVVATTSVGFDAFDVPLLTANGVALCNTPGVLSAAVADLTMALLLMLSRRLMEFEAYARSGGWGRREPYPALANDPLGKTIGLVGFGRIGREVARRAVFAGMKVLWYDIFDTSPADAPPAERRTLDELLAESDFVSIHTDLNQSSRHMISAREIGLMKPTAYLINTSRGPAVDQAALHDALVAGRIAGAGLDVLEQEPPDPEEPIVKLSNVITFPHIGTATRRRATRCAPWRPATSSTCWAATSPRRLSILRCLAEQSIHCRHWMRTSNHGRNRSSRKSRHRRS